jgi:hypothetical protein
VLADQYRRRKNKLGLLIFVLLFLLKIALWFGNSHLIIYPALLICEIKPTGEKWIFAIFFQQNTCLMGAAGPLLERPREAAALVAGGTTGWRSWPHGTGVRDPTWNASGRAGNSGCVFPPRWESEAETHRDWGPCLPVGPASWTMGTDNLKLCTIGKKCFVLGRLDQLFNSSCCRFQARFIGWTVWAQEMSRNVLWISKSFPSGPLFKGTEEWDDSNLSRVSNRD